MSALNMKNLAIGSWSKLILFLTTCLISTSFVRTEGFDSLLQLPRSGSPRVRTKSKRALFVRDFGAKGDGFHNDTQAFKDAWDVACAFPGRTRVIVPAGYKFLVHPVNLAGRCKSKVTLDISGEIVAPKDPAYWNGLNRRKWLYFHEVNHLTVEGGGRINGMGWRWWMQSCKINKRNPCRHAPTAITFHKCKDLKVSNLTLVNSQQMHISFTNCIRVTISQIIVRAPAFSPNTDGIHISASRGVEIKDAMVETGDDCISIVSNSSRIRIRNIECGPGHGISIGSLGKSNSSSQVRSVIVDTAFLSNTNNGVRIKTWQGGGGNVTDIKFQNILMQNVSNPIIIDQYYCDSRSPCANQTSAVKVKNVSFTHIKGTSATDEAIKFACSDWSPCEGLYLEDIELVSSTGGVTESICWEAYGSSMGLVVPPSCFSWTESSIKQKGSAAINSSINTYSPLPTAKEHGGSRPSVDVHERAEAFIKKFKPQLLIQKLESM